MIKDTYIRWCSLAIEDADIASELTAMEQNEAWIEEAFYRNLAFGTGGLRGVIGAGSNRMNVYTVAKASQGLADYVNRTAQESERRIAISYDSRIKSDLFAKTAAEVFAANGIKVWIYDELMPTPCLSYAVRNLSCSAGVMITASHNPAKYNGYKVYGVDGCQITTKAAEEILAEIEKLDVFADVKRIPFERAVENGRISYIPEMVTDNFIEEIKRQSVLYTDAADRSLSIVYSPLNGTGRNPVLRALRESGFSCISVVKEQEQPDGNFPTCPYPNPEIKEAMELGRLYAAHQQADLLLATDPDCDRVGIAVRKEGGDYVLLSGNEVGVLLLDFICAQRSRHGCMPQDPVAVKTIVTTDMAECIAKKYGVRVVNVLTGFKFIGEQIGRLEQCGAPESYLFGFEESYGYLSGTYVRDKDGVNGAVLICEMAAYYNAKGITLLTRLEELYCEHGYFKNSLDSYTLEGIAGFEIMQKIMKTLRSGITDIGGKRVERVLDYGQGVDGLPKSDVLKFFLEGNCSVVVRPSGTEPKLKVYVSVCGKDTEELTRIERVLQEDMGNYIKNAKKK